MNGYTFLIRIFPDIQESDHVPSFSVAGKSSLMATVSSKMAIVVAVTFMLLEGLAEALQVPCMAQQTLWCGMCIFWHLGPENVVCI